MAALDLRSIIRLSLAITVLFFYFLSVTPAQGAPTKQGCHQGEYLNTTSNLCLLCRPGTYQDKEHHTSTDCAECTKENPYHHQVVIAKCTTVKDSEVGCQEGFYAPHKFKGHPFDCERCSTCTNQTVLENCSQSRDAVCGPPNSPMIPATTNDLTSLPPSSGLTDGPHRTYNTTLSDGNSTDDHLKLFGIFCIAMSLLSLVPLFIVPLIYFADKTARHS